MDKYHVFLAEKDNHKQLQVGEAWGNESGKIRNIVIKKWLLSQDVSFRVT
jgi:hypothetical protein